MKKYQYLASWDDQTLTRVGEPVVVLGDSNVSQVEVTLPSNFLLDPTKAECRMYFMLPGKKESDHDVLETATKDDNGDSHVTWTIKHVHSQKGGRLAFSLTIIGDDAQWDSRTAIIPVYESRYQPESEEAEEPYTGRLAALEGSMASIRGEFAEVQDDFEELKETATLGTPIPKSLASEMVEGGVYLYTGSEAGYTAGHVYYYVGGALTDGGVYGGTAIDATLTQSGQAADAKVTGDEIATIKEDLNAKQDALTFDTAPTLGSTNPVTSGGVATALTNITVPVDATLTQSGEAADAKATGDAINAAEEHFSALLEPFSFAVAESGTGFYRVVNSRYSLNPATGYYYKLSNKISSRAGIVYKYHGSSGSGAFGVAFLNQNNTVLSTKESGAIGRERIVFFGPAPEGTAYVIFQSCTTTSVEDAVLDVSIESKQIGDIVGATHDVGSVLTATAYGVKFCPLDAYADLVKTELDFNRYIGIKAEEPGYYASNNNGLICIKDAAYVCKHTRLIPVFEGMKFSVQSYNAASGIRPVFAFDSDMRPSTDYTYTGANAVCKEVVIGPETKWIMFQGSKNASSESDITLAVDLLYPFNPHKRLMPLDGVKWTAIGDSITIYGWTDGYYAGYMRMFKNFDNANITNLGVSGSGFVAGNQNAYINKIASIPPDVQFISIAGSFNDVNHLPAGGLGTPDDTDGTTACGIINAFFDALIEAFPTVPMACYMQGPWAEYHPGIDASDAYVEALRTICSRKGIPFNDDMYYRSNLKPWNQAFGQKYYARGGTGGTYGDGIHPGSRGGRLIYNQLRPWIVSLVADNLTETLPGCVLDYLSHWDINT